MAIVPSSGLIERCPSILQQSFCFAGIVGLVNCNTNIEVGKHLLVVQNEGLGHGLMQLLCDADWFFLVA